MVLQSTSDQAPKYPLVTFVLSGVWLRALWMDFSLILSHINIFLNSLLTRNY